MEAGGHKDSDSERYAVVHDLYGGRGPSRASQGLSFDHLAGYLEGATAGYWSGVDLHNGIGAGDANRLELGVIERLGRDKLVTLLEKAGLRAHYPDLIE